MINQEELKTLLKYDETTGIFTRISGRGGKPSGSIAGGYDPTTGYIRIKVKEVLYKAHRLAWLYIKGEWPKDQIDHIDRNRVNNIWQNLRQATKSENLKNKNIYKSNKSGFKGVCWHKRINKWQANCRNNGITNHIGYFDSAEAASIAYKNYVHENVGNYYTE